MFETFITFFYANIKNNSFHKNSICGFMDDLYVLGWPELYLTIFRKCLSMTKIEASVTRKPMHSTGFNETLYAP